jgi:membrane protease YdiL (CAAX protease family)
MKALRRAVVLALLAVVVAFGTTLLSDDGTANIGAGLLAFLAVIIAAFVWGLRDARRDPLGQVLLRWVLVGVVVGLAVAVLPQVGSDEFFSVSTYLSDVPYSATFGFALTLTASALGAAVGALLGRRPAADADRPPGDGPTSA